MSSAGISYFTTKWFVNNISSSTTCFCDTKVILNPLHLHNQDSSILFEDLWFVETPPSMDLWVGIWVDGWVKCQGVDWMLWFNHLVSFNRNVMGFENTWLRIIYYLQIIWQENRKFQWRSWSATIPSVGVSTDFTSLNRIELSQFVQDLLHF